MGHSYYHACSSAATWGGTPEEYQPIHDFLDSSKASFCDARHRSILHHSFGVFVAERVFGTTLLLSCGKEVPVRLIAERHIREDCGGLVPSVQDWLARLPLEPWMINSAQKLSEIPPALPSRRKISIQIKGTIPPLSSSSVSPAAPSISKENPSASGGGDSGAVDHLDFIPEHITLPTKTLEELTKATESLTYSLLEEHGYDYFNNGGGSGQLIINTTEMRWELNCEFYSEYEEDEDNQNYSAPTTEGTAREADFRKFITSPHREERIKAIAILPTLLPMLREQARPVSTSPTPNSKAAKAKRIPSPNF